MHTPQNPSAFPTQSGHWDGMTLRDYFAGQALVAIGSHLYFDQLEAATTLYGVTQAEYLSAMSYTIADAMLAERVREAGR